MPKGKKQTAEELLQRYSQETVTLAAAVTPAPAQPEKRVDPLLESLRRNINRVVMLPLDLLVIEENVRRQVDETSPEFLSLVDSVQESGIRQNIIVDLQDEDPEHFKVLVVAGQRRTLAGKKAGVKQVAALILRMNGRGERLIEGLAENLLREDLHCLDQAEAYAALIEEGWTQDEIAEKFERRRRTILQFLRLARYPQEARDYIRLHREQFTTHLLFNKFVAKTWKNNAELMKALHSAIEPRPTVAPVPERKIAPKLEQLTQAIDRHSDLKSQVTGNEKAGKLTIRFQSPEALEKLIALFEPSRKK
jgi:ParB/RepB/Spo0J family partition protein